MNVDYYGRRRKKRSIDRLPMIVMVPIVLLCYATVLVLAVMAIVGMAQVASAGDLREFVLCEHATGKEHGPMIQEGVKTTGVFRTKPEVVARLIEIHGNKCTMIVNSNGAHVSVVGSAAEVECRLLGGNNCADRKPEE